MNGFQCWLCEDAQPEDDVFCERCRKEFDADFRQIIVSAKLDSKPNILYNESTQIERVSDAINILTHEPPEGRFQ